MHICVYLSLNILGYKSQHFIGNTLQGKYFVLHILVYS